jgi:transposase InsO family protein
MSADDVTARLKLALQASGLDQADADRWPRLLYEEGPSFVPNDLSEWLEAQGMRYTRSKPYHSITQRKIEQWHQTFKNHILIVNYDLPGELQAKSVHFVDHYNPRRDHESLDNCTPADVYFGRGARMQKRRKDVKRRTIEQRRRQHFNAAELASTRWA